MTSQSKNKYIFLDLWRKIEFSKLQLIKVGFTFSRENALHYFNKNQSYHFGTGDYHVLVYLCTNIKYFVKAV